MSLRIYKPQKYSGFTMGGDSTYKWYNPNTNPSAADPYDNENLVTEIARYTGSTTQHYADTGECSFTVDIAAVEPNMIKSGYLVETDSGIYRIESIEWRQEDNGYTCTFGGRGIESFLDDAVYEHSTETGAPYFDDEVTAVTLAKVSRLFTFAANSAVHNPNNVIYPMRPTLLPCASQVGALRFFFQNSTVGIEYTTSAMTNGAGSTAVIENGLSVGAILRTWLNWLGCGYRVERVTYSSTSKKFYTVALYNKDPNKVIELVADKERGVSGFSYFYDKRDAVNQVLYSFLTACPSSQRVDSDKTANNRDFRNMSASAPLPRKLRCSSAFMRGFEAASSFTDYSMQGASKYIDLGEIPDKTDENAGSNMHDGSVTASHNWVNAQMSANDLVYPTEQVTFTYDNSGRYKYGVDFFLGSTVKVVNDTLGVTATQMLTKVTTNYVAGDAVSYGFEFGNQRITQADKLKTKFATVDKRTYRQ